MERGARIALHRRLGPVLFLLILLWTAPSPVLADSWPGPRVQRVFSENGEFFAEITPGDRLGDTVGFAGSGGENPAHAKLFRRQSDGGFDLTAHFNLANPIAPVDGRLSNDGRLITFDNWHNAGYGAVVAIYDPAGKSVATYPLERLYSEKQIDSIPQSVSSRWWRCAPIGWVDPEQQTKVFVGERFGGMFIFELASGAVEYQPGEAVCTETGGPISTTTLH